MTTLIDTSLWIDFTRARSPMGLKQFIAPYILHPAAHLADPVAFEILRHASPAESKQLLEHFETLPRFETPADLWSRAIGLGQACRQNGYTAGSIDLLIASVALTYQANLITFDEDFLKIAEVCNLRVKFLSRPGKR